MSQMGEPARIYLQPECCATPDVGRLWCEDDEPVECEEGRPWTEYVRADLAGDRALAAPVAAGMLERHIATLSEARFKCDGTREVSMSWQDAIAFLRSVEPVGGSPEVERLDALEARLGLHESVEVHYFVDRYEAQLVTHDGATTLVIAKGDSIPGALAALSRALATPSESGTPEPSDPYEHIPEPPEAS